MKRQNVALSLLTLITVLGIYAKPAKAIDLGPFQGIYDRATSVVGNFFGLKLTQYMDVAFTKFEEWIGIDLDSVKKHEDQGFMSPNTVYEVIDQKVEEIDADEIDRLNSEIESGLRGAEASARISKAVVEGVFGEDAQQATKEVNEQTSALVRSQGELAKQAQRSQITQDVMKYQSQQLAQSSVLLDVISKKQDMTNQQLAAGNLSAAESSAKATRDERRLQEGANASATSNLVQAAFINGILED